MSKVDTAWLRMDSPTNLMMIVGVWTLKPGIGYDELCRRIEDTLVKYSRFHQRVVEDAAGASWVEHPVNVREHVLREKLPRHRKDELHTVLQQRVGELAVLPLDRNKPLWEIHLIEDYDGGSALVFRIHHCIADGIALMSVTMSIVDGGPPPPERGGRRKPEGTEEWIAQALVKPLAGILTKALDSAGDGAAKSFALLRGPGKGVSETLEIARVGYQVLADAASLILMDDDTKTRLKGKPGGVKRVAWCPPLPLDEVKAIGRALNCSVNDVLLSCVAGAIGGYLRACGDDTRGAEIRAMVPVNLRPLEEAHKLGNRFGLAPLVLPIGIENPVERVYEVRRRMRALKDSTQPFLAFVVLAFAGLMIKPVQDAILDMFGRKTTAVMTNVPGPRQKLKFLGSNLEQSMFWVPQSGDVGMGVSVLSYGDGVQFGLIADISLCPDPQAIIDGFEPEFAKLSLVTLMLPWGEGQL
ncbi:MAG TPA: wax ester/triacylglycerol synthase family O-acyltransferase [Ramlibacter sp.]|nr:wax ester/triacylglycerol synthase family O-acyltransferase [Ramlibacter sp.]HVZ42294.1 wax ester/triacylglycerol synthase family O-acyltransferase [Ramlibacter sp.]